MITTLAFNTLKGRRFTHWITVEGEDLLQGATRKKKNKNLVARMESMFGPEGQRWTWTANGSKPIIRFQEEKDLLFWLLKYPNKYR